MTTTGVIGFLLILPVLLVAVSGIWRGWASETVSSRQEVINPEQPAAAGRILIARLPAGPEIKLDKLVVMEFSHKRTFTFTGKSEDLSRTCLLCRFQIKDQAWLKKIRPPVTVSGVLDIPVGSGGNRLNVWKDHWAAYPEWWPSDGIEAVPGRAGDLELARWFFEGSRHSEVPPIHVYLMIEVPGVHTLEDLIAEGTQGASIIPD